MDKRSWQGCLAPLNPSFSCPATSASSRSSRPSRRRITSPHFSFFNSTLFELDSKVSFQGLPSLRIRIPLRFEFFWKLFDVASNWYLDVGWYTWMDRFFATRDCETERDAVDEWRNQARANHGRPASNNVLNNLLRYLVRTCRNRRGYYESWA